MATRTISTKLAVEGESQYRESITRINGEIKSLQSALKLTESQYQNNANSMAALAAKGDALNNLYAAQASKIKELRAALDNARTAEANYAAKKAELTAKIEANVKALEDLKAGTGDTAAEQERLTAENQALSAELAKNEASLAAATRGVTNWKDKLNTAEIKLNDLDAELKLNDKYLDEASRSADGCATSIDEFGNKTKQTTNAVDALAQTLAAAGVTQAVKKIAESLNDCVQSSTEFESALAGVAKTSDLQGDALKNLGEDFKALSERIPVAATEIANVAEAAGQLGIAQEDLLDFTEVMVNLGASTELSSTEAASALAKFANVVNMSSDDYSRLGSTIVDLGNNFATTEADIVSMATRLASTGSLVGLTEAEIMAIATALSSVGIEAEAGGSAISKLLKQFETMVATASPQLSDFAAIAGMSAEEFSVAWGEGAVGALSAFIDGLGAVDASGGSAVAVLDELGITEVRLSNAVLSMASSNGILNDALTTANSAWTENIALTNEASTRYATTESKFQLFKNSIENVKIAIGDQLTPALGNLANTGADVLNWAAEFVEENEWLAPAIAAVGTALTTGTVALTGYTTAVNVIIPAVKAFSAALSANPASAVALAIGTVVTALTTLIALLPDVTSEYDSLSAASKQQYDELQDLNAEYERVCKAYGETSAEAQLLKKKLDEATTAFEQNKRTAEQVAAAHEEVITAHNDLASSYEQTISGIDTERESAIHLAQKLEDLMAVENKTAASKQEILAVVELLNDAIPELGLVYDEYSDSLNTTADGLRDLIEAEIEREKHQADYTQLKELIREEESLYDTLLTCIDETTAAEQRLADAQVARNKAQEDFQLLGYVDGMAYATSMQPYIDAVTQAQKDVDTLTEAENVARQAYQENQASIETLTESVATYTAEVNTASDAETRATESAESILSKINELAQSYRDAYDAAHESISGQIGLFDSYAASISADTDTATEMMARWSEQTDNLAKYTENLEKAAKYGLDDGLVQSLSDGSTESAGYLAVIIEEIERLGGTTEGMSEDAQTFVDDFNASFAETEQAKAEFAEVVATMETDFFNAVASIEKAADEADFSGVTEAMEEAFANVGVDFQSIGSDAASGFSSGIESGSSIVSSSSQGIAQAAIDACRATLDSHSDSRVMIQVGKDFVGGLVTGIEGRQGELTSTVESLGDGITEVMTTSIKETVDESMNEFSKISARAKVAMNDLKSTVNSAASGFSLYSTGQDLVNGMINGLNNRSGSLYSTVRSIVNQAIRTAKNAAAVASPSKKTTEIFEFVGDGMAVGLENRRKKVKDTMQSVVDDSLHVDISGKIQEIREAEENIPVIDMVNSPQSGTVIQNNDNRVEVAELIVREEVDIEKVARKLYTMQRSNARSKGVLA